jgi:hypothetical protein
MIHTDHRREPRRTVKDPPARRSSRASATRHRRSASFSDAVIAAYIRELRHEGVQKRPATPIVAIDSRPD